MQPLSASDHAKIYAGMFSVFVLQAFMAKKTGRNSVLQTMVQAILAESVAVS